jgi:polysaccharide biosynthesis/export protein
MKDHTAYLVYGLMIILFVSCVPPKKLIYLQEDEEVYLPQYANPYTEKEYLLKPRDLITISITSLTPGQYNFFGGGDEEGSENVNVFKIDTAGYVELPTIGKVFLEGLNMDQAQDKIKSLLEDYLKDPFVKIKLDTPFEFTILGEVNVPGRYPIEKEYLSVFKAIGMAGDLSTYGDRKNVKIVRHYEDGTMEIRYINLLDASLLNREDYFIRSNDLILISPLNARSTRENQLFVINTILGFITTIAVLILTIDNIQN